MTHKNEVRNTVIVEQHSPHAWITDWCKNGNFKSSIISMEGDILVRYPKAGQRCKSQTRVSSMFLYGTNNPSYNNSPRNYNYCSPAKDPDFSSYHPWCWLYTVVVIRANWHMILVNRKGMPLMPVSWPSSQAFDTTCPCAICGKVGYIFKDCEKLKCPVAIWKTYIQLCVVLQMIKGMGAHQNCDVDPLRSLTISYVNSVILLLPLP